MTRHDDDVALEIETPDGRYRCEAEWVIAADGARSAARRLMGLDFRGKVFEDRFLIADIRIDADFPTERWFWFDPPFHQGGSALLHRQADGLWRIDLQLGWTADPEAEKRPERVIPRLKAMFGADARRSTSSGSASTRSSAAAWSGSGTAASSSPATPPTRSRRSARAAAIPACRTPTICAGNWRWC